MSKLEKIAEARFFVSEMQHAHTRDPFRYCLSAFLSAARSVLQYAHKDATGNQIAKTWYDGMMNASRVLQFFKDKRDFNIHSAPVPVQMEVAVEIIDHVSLTESVTVTIQRGGVIVEQFETGDSTPPPPPLPPPEIKTRYFFTDWQPQDVLELCEMYIDELEIVVTEGLARGFIQP